jgi:hypothetical protein
MIGWIIPHLIAVITGAGVIAEGWRGGRAHEGFRDHGVVRDRGTLPVVGWQGAVERGGLAAPNLSMIFVPTVISEDHRALADRAAAGRAKQDLLLMDPAHSMLDAETAEQMRALVAKGALSPGVMATTDCRGDYAALTEAGVGFIAPPAERPYGVEAILRDDSGNWFSFTQRN